MVIDRNRSEKIATRFSKKTFDRIDGFAAECDISRSEAIRVLVEDRLDELSYKDLDRKSYERLTRAIEYLFISSWTQNAENLSDEERQKLMADMWANHAKYHHKVER